MKIEKDKLKVEYYSKSTIIAEAKTYYGKSSITNEELLTYMIGDDYNYGKYTVYKYSNKIKRTFVNRINLIWFMPLYVLTIPFQWLFLGEIGINKNSKLGHFIDKLVRIYPN